jgi:hypothetical protein
LIAGEWAGRLNTTRLRQRRDHAVGEDSFVGGGERQRHAITISAYRSSGGNLRGAI